MPQLCSHFLHHVVDTRVALMLLEGFEQVELRVLFNLHTEVVKGTNGCIAGEEVVWTRTERDDLQVAQSDDGTCDGHEVVNQFGTFSCVADGIFGDVSLRLAEFQGVAGIQHAAVCIATAVDEVFLCLLGCSAEHGGTIEIVGEHGLRNFRSEIAKVHAERVASSFLDVLQCLLHVDFALYDADGTLVDVVGTVFFYILSNKSLTAIYGQRLRETVTAHRNDSDFHLWYVIHFFDRK